MIGFLSPGKIHPQSVLPTLDWAHEVAGLKDVTVMSGFASKLEREVLSILLAGKCKIVLMLARRMYAKVPCELREAVENGRLEIRSVSSAMRQDKSAASKRNKTIAENCDTLLMPCRPVSSSSLSQIADLPKTQFLFTP